ncbi:hypothetical protein [Cetobacterium ceti]
MGKNLEKKSSLWKSSLWMIGLIVAVIFVLFGIIALNGWILLRDSNKMKINSSVTNNQVEKELKRDYLKSINFTMNFQKVLKETGNNIKISEILWLEKEPENLNILEAKIIKIIKENNNKIHLEKLKRDYLKDSSSMGKYIQGKKNLEERKYIINFQNGNILYNNKLNATFLPANEKNILVLLKKLEKKKKNIKNAELEYAFLENSQSKKTFDKTLEELKKQNILKMKLSYKLDSEYNTPLSIFSGKEKKIMDIFYINRNEFLSEKDIENIYLKNNFDGDYEELLKDEILKKDIDGIIYRDKILSSNEKFIIFMTLLFMFSIVIRLWRDREKINEFQKFKDILDKNEDYTELNEDIERNLKNSFIEEKWETYIKTFYVDENSERYETVDPDFYFNFDILYKDEIRYKFYTYMPQTILGLGMLGTFYGLSIGLSQLNLSNVDSIQNGVGDLLSGVKTAFYTSLFGLSYSILFSVFNSAYFSEIEKLITNIKDKIEKLAKKNINEASVKRIIKALEKIESSNGDMATNIGNQINLMSENLNTNIQQFSNNIGGNFKEELSGALDKIFNEDFMNNMNKSLTQMSEVFLENSNKMIAFKDEISDSISQLIQLKDSYSIVIKETYELKENFNSSMENINEKLKNVVVEVDNIANKYEKTSEELGTLLTSMVSTQDNNIQILEGNKNVMEVATTLLENSKDILSAEKSVQDLWNSYDDTFKEINITLSENLSLYKDNLEETVVKLREVLKENSNEYNMFIKNQTVDYTTEIKKGMINLFTDYDQNLSTVINKFNGVLLNFNDNMNTLSELILETKETIDEHMEIINKSEKGEEE